FWRKESLATLGLTINLGHNGLKCPVALDDPRRMTVTHSRGIEEVAVRFCACLNDDLDGTPDCLQLIEHDLWPASWEKPMSAFTVDVLKEFHLLSLQSQMTAQDFIRYLQRRTDNVQTDQVPDRYRELLRTMQEFIWIRAVKRAGLEPRRGMAPGSLAVLCPACPQPDINMDLGWISRPMHLRYLDALYHTVDGNFHQNQREKPSDPDDFALSEGAGYF
ncbi:hypothetical protein CERSUDRAFT_25709, partial [Gelatoporia subvermispora B]